MMFLRLVAFGGMLFALGIAAVPAQSAPAPADAGAMKAHCASGDPRVLVNKSAKTYTLDMTRKNVSGSAKALAANDKPGMSEQSLTSASTDTGMQPASMCRSAAKRMGAKLAG